eukprot:54945-Rhodomonas_salina.2
MTLSTLPHATCVLPHATQRYLPPSCFIDTRGQGELSFDEFMAAFDLKSRLVRRMSQMEEAANVHAMLMNTHQ